MSATNRQLGIFSLTTLLVSAHYGLGFILGTAEQATTEGVGGSLYAVSVGLGTLALVMLAKFYWREVEQIWTLLGKRYGKPVKVGIGLMSWTSLIGIEAVQIIAAASILSVVGIPKSLSMVTLTLLFCLLSLLPVERASWIFRGLLLFNILSLFYALWQLHGWSEYWQAPIEFIPTLAHIKISEAIGVFLSTILLVLIDMKCQQFVVQSKDLRTAYLGSVLAGIVLIGLAFLPSVVVIAAQNAGILPPELDSKEVIPYILSWIGGGSDRPWGMIFIAALAVPALGIGSNILRIQNKAILDLEIIYKAHQYQIFIAIINASLALAIAFKGGEIIGLILNFYAAYLSAVWVPFGAYLLDYTKVYTFSETSVRLSLFISVLAALAALIVVLFYPEASIFGSTELTIMALGIGFGSLSLLSIQIIEKSSLLTQEKTEP